MHADEDYESKIEEDENDYSDFYNTADDENEENKDNKENKNKRITLIIVALSIVLIVLIALLVILLRKEKPIDFNLSLKDINGDAWSKENVTINIDVPKEDGLKKLKYTINCSKEPCDYVDVTDKKIVISNSGVSDVTVISVNNNNVEKKKNITVKIDNTNPAVTLSPNETNINSDKTVTVCAICTDNESGCKEEQVCKEYTKTSKDQTITVEDKVGNKTTTSKFNVTIGSTSKVPAPSCSLSVNSSGVVTAKYSSASSYHGFSSSYSGTNATTKQVRLEDSNKTTKVVYYVKNSEGKTASCSITVKASNCYCRFRDDKARCYINEVKTITDPNSKECANAQKKTNSGCAFYKDEGLTCTYSEVKAK